MKRFLCVLPAAPGAPGEQSAWARSGSWPDPPEDPLPAAPSRCVPERGGPRPATHAGGLEGQPPTRLPLRGGLWRRNWRCAPSEPVREGAVLYLCRTHHSKGRSLKQGAWWLWFVPTILIPCQTLFVLYKCIWQEAPVPQFWKTVTSFIPIVRATQTPREVVIPCFEVGGWCGGRKETDLPPLLH